MKKALLAIFSVMLCVVLVFAGCSDDSEGAQGSIVDNTEDTASVAAQSGDSMENVKSDNKILEGESITESNLGKGVELFMGGSYYLEGTIYSSGQAMKSTLATDGTNIQLTATEQDISFGVLVLDDATYAIQPESKKYTELSDALLQALDLEDSLSVSEFQEIRENTDDSDGKVVQMAVTINGDPGLCTEFDYEDTKVKLYSIDDNLIQVDNFDENGNLVMQIVVDSITADIPSDQLTLKGLAKASISEFIASFING